MVRSVDVACLQTRPMPDTASALAEALELVESAVAAGAELLALPEYCGGLKTEGGLFAPPSFPEEHHPVLSELRSACAKHAVSMVIGSIAVDGPSDKICNRGYVIDPAGEILSRYDKIHLFDVKLSDDEVYLESAVVEAGSRTRVVETQFGKLGYSICYDLRFPQLYRHLSQCGAEILLVPAAFTKRTGAAHWHVLNRARAIENGAFVVAPCAVGSIEGGGASYGHSLIIDPWGKVVADGGDIPGVVQATIDLDQVAAVRSQIPSLTHDQNFILAEQEWEQKIS